MLVPLLEASLLQRLSQRKDTKKGRASKLVKITLTNSSKCLKISQQHSLMISKMTLNSVSLRGTVCQDPKIKGSKPSSTR